MCQNPRARTVYTCTCGLKKAKKKSLEDLEYEALIAEMHPERAIIDKVNPNEAIIDKVLAAYQKSIEDREYKSLINHRHDEYKPVVGAKKMSEREKQAMYEAVLRIVLPGGELPRTHPLASTSQSESEAMRALRASRTPRNQNRSTYY